MPLRRDLAIAELTPEDFQLFCVDLANTQFAETFTVYGKSGESQDGIDVKPLIGASVCIQCKRFSSVGQSSEP